MSYEKIRTLESYSEHVIGELLVKLDSAHYVALACYVSYHKLNTMDFRPTARWVDENGEPLTDHRGVAIEVEYSHNIPVDHAEQIDIPIIRRELLLLVLGEPFNLDENGDKFLNVSDAIRTSANIRTAIAAASASGHHDISNDI